MIHHYLEKVSSVTTPLMLISTPMWIGALENFNVFLTTCTLLLGLVLGFMKLTDYFKSRMSEDETDTD
jgi:hypothetical protein